MDAAALSPEQQGLVSSFLEIAVGQNADTAVHFLQLTNWILEEAIQLFFVGGDGAVGAAAAAPAPSAPPAAEDPSSSVNVSQDVGEDGVRAPLPVKRETLYGDAALFNRDFRFQQSPLIAFRNFEEESKRQPVWESDKNAPSTANGSRDNLASLYRPPFDLMFNGTFDKAKVEASHMDKWLLVNLQSTAEFNSHMLNRDTWSNETVAQTISTNFIFWQVYHDSTEGKKVCTYYNLVAFPSILVIDPITGQKMRAWNGMITPERLLEDLLPFLEKGPNENHVTLPPKRARQTPHVSVPSVADTLRDEDEEVLRAIAASLEEKKVAIRPSTAKDEPKVEKEPETILSKKLVYPPLPEEPKEKRELLSRVGIRLPDGRRLQRHFLRADSIKLLWSFCSSQLEGGEERPFRFTQSIPGASKTLEFDSDVTFEESGISNSMISLTWI
ncbi:plant UBX domain-containing protein 7 [Dioscorea cayenensis subsp. rotundata]|uniref:UBX domain-containing protein n=1 Tax=Dioscorea cayennensis subsp. rotundata TaxID=55577 RepID=A0AB40BHG7_DIOCR|nr:plant UBX domain-containing protein 7 [Dioscorea cayenensis subsp. rotundata]